MAAHSISASHLPAKKKKCIDGERRRARSNDPETALGMQFHAVIEKLAIDILVMADFDGAAVNSAVSADLSDDDAIALAELTAALIKESPAARTVTTTRGFVHVDTVEAKGRTFALGAFARHGIPEPIGVARAVAGAARILRDGLAFSVEAPMPLVERGWGDWDDLG
ncbi:MAG: hypothetical protein ACXWUG_07050 [Polyangiales bacterium]